MNGRICELRNTSCKRISFRSWSYPGLSSDESSLPFLDVRMTKLCKHGHEMTPENTYILPNTYKSACKTCRRAAAKKARDQERRATQRAKEMVGI